MEVNKKTVPVERVISKLSEAKDPAHAVLLAYHAVYPHFDDIPGEIPWPRATQETAKQVVEEIMRLFPEHDRVQVNLLWLQYGFSTLDSEHLEDGEIEPAET